MILKKPVFYAFVTLFFIIFSTLVYKVHNLDQSLSVLARPARLFNPSSIISKFSNRPEWEVYAHPDHHSFFHVLSQQQLNWIGKGAQAIVFVTQDQKHVVKFFQVGNIRERKGFSAILERFLGDKRGDRRKSQREEMFSSSKTCYENLAHETGIVYVHLNKTNELIKGVKLVDKFGQSHRIRGDDACFVVQKKASYVIPTFTALMDDGKFLEAQNRVDQIFDLVLAVTRKGYIDTDEALIRNNNLGFLENSAIYIDTGHIFKCENIDLPSRMEYEFNIRLKPLEQWLSVAYPTLAEYYMVRRNEIMENLNYSVTQKEVAIADTPQELDQKNNKELEIYSVLI